MRVLVLAAVGGIALAAAGCSGGSCGSSDDSAVASQTSTPAASATPASTVVPSASPAGSPAAASPSGRTDLAAALLTVSDMPSGWTETNLNIDLAATQPCGRPIPVVDAATGQQEAAYRENRLGPYVAQRVMAYAGGDAAQAMSATRTLLEECKEWKGNHAGRELTFRVSPSPLQVSGLGDEAFAVQLTIEGFAGGGLVGGLLNNVVSAKSVVVVVRQGGYTFLLAQADGGVGNPSVDGGRTEQLARLAEQRLVAAIRD